MIDLLCAFRLDDHPIRLNQEFRRDLTWWRELFQTWDGLSFFCMPTWAPVPDFQVSSDAAGSLGYGAIFNTKWFCGAWSMEQRSLSIAYKELFPIVVAAALWGSQWGSRRVEFLCDNESVVAVLKSGTSRDHLLMGLLPFSSSGTSSRPDSLCDSRVAAGRTPDVLTQRCQFLLSQGLAPSTRRVYLSAQRRYIDFCRRDGRLNSDGPFPPADEETLMRFASLLADNLTHASIKVYLSAVRSLHIDHGLSDPFVNCLRLQRLLRGIKRVQGPVSPRRLPITLDHLRAIQHRLDFSRRDHVMLWAACCLGFFGFLRAGEFTVNSAFQPSIHMTVADLQADSLVNPTCFKVHIKCSKTDPFRMGCDVYVGRGEGLVCPIRALGNFLVLRGSSEGPLFTFSDGRPLTRQQLSST
ncbi:unnamed protein product, partial [Porites lobata]